MRILLAALCCLASACSLLLDSGSAGSSADASPPRDDCLDWQSGFFDPCAAGQSGPELVLRGGVYVYDTATGELRDPSDTILDVETPVVAIGESGTTHLLNVERLVIDNDATLRAVNGNSLVIAAWSGAEIRGVLDVGSIAGSQQRAAGVRDCDVAGADGAENSAMGAGGSGGAGGSHATAGGGGGASAKVPDVVPGGVSGPILAAGAIAGGCAGGFGIGRVSDDPPDVGAAGAGGGAVLLASRNAIEVKGAISAGGAGGDSGLAWAGGGGGGAGGMVVLEAESIVLGVGARLLANGGGGGGASAHDERGYPGQDASPPGPADGGGYVHEHAAPGGAGAFGSVDAVTGSDGEDSGGGGGGGFGYIRLLGAGLFDQGAFLSPLPRYQ